MKKILTLLMFAFICNAQAQTTDFAELIPSTHLQKDLTASIGLGIVSVPKYTDSSKQQIRPLPILDLQWKSGVFFSTVSGLGIDLSSNPSWQYGVRLGLIANQEQSANNRDNGPGNTSTNLAPGIFANYLLDKHFSILTALTTGAGNGKHPEGFTASVGGRVVHRINNQHSVYGILGTTWASDKYMQDYYGVTTQQAMDYPFPAYETSAGMLKVKLSVGWNWAMNKNWSIITGGALVHPLGDARTSPLSSDKNQYVAYSAAYYRF